VPHPAQCDGWLNLQGRAESLGWDQGPGVPLMAGLAAPLQAGRGAGGRRLPLTAGESDEGGFEELVEFRLSRTSNSAILRSRDANAARRAAWASGGPDAGFSFSRRAWLATNPETLAEASPPRRQPHQPE
jgi:hypothetical protein